MKHKNIISLIQGKKESLLDEIKAIDFTNIRDKFDVSDYDKIRTIELKAKVQLLNELVISYGIQKPK